MLQSWLLEGFAMAVVDAKLLEMGTVGVRGSHDCTSFPVGSVTDQSSFVHAGGSEDRNDAG